MLKNKQLCLDNPEEGVYGDCYRTVIACLLNKLPHEVPHPTDPMLWKPENIELWHQHFEDYLNQQGLSTYTYFTDGTLEHVLNMIDAINPNVYVILGGKSSNNTNHVVIVKDGAIVWDPAIDNSGIVGPLDHGFFQVTVLIPLFLKQ